LLIIGKTELNYSEREIMHMTLRKFMLLYTEFKKYNGTYTAPASLDDVIPL
jgi:hypothetical protein